jgi:hypothetical protein
VSLKPLALQQHSTKHPKNSIKNPAPTDINAIKLVLKNFCCSISSGFIHFISWQTSGNGQFIEPWLFVPLQVILLLGTVVIVVLLPGEQLKGVFVKSQNAVVESLAQSECSLQTWPSAIETRAIQGTSCIVLSTLKKKQI